jgi:hypothetical protein
MGRNHFSQHGGPYFINDGFSKHNDPKPGISHDDIKLSKTIFYSIMIGFAVILTVVGFTLNSLS